VGDAPTPTGGAARVFGLDTKSYRRGCRWRRNCRLGGINKILNIKNNPRSTTNNTHTRLYMRTV
jgi:hypothetical protein